MGLSNQATKTFIYLLTQYAFHQLNLWLDPSQGKKKKKVLRHQTLNRRAVCISVCVCLCNKILKVESDPNLISADGRVWAVRGKWLTGDSKQVLVIDAISSRRAALRAGKCSLQ